MFPQIEICLGPMTTRGDWTGHCGLFAAEIFRVLVQAPFSLEDGLANTALEFA